MTVVDRSWSDAMTNSPEMPDTCYVPIHCDVHSQYELACLKRRPVHLTWISQNIVYDQVIVPIDVRTEAHAEYLIVRLASGEEKPIRLDHIRRMNPA